MSNVRADEKQKVIKRIFLVTRAAQASSGFSRAREGESRGNWMDVDSDASFPLP